MAVIGNEKIKARHILSWHANLTHISPAVGRYGKCSNIYKRKQRKKQHVRQKPRSTIVSVHA